MVVAQTSILIAPSSKLNFGLVINQMSLMKKDGGYEYLAMTLTWIIPRYSFACDDAVKMAFDTGFVVACADNVVVSVGTKGEYFSWNIFVVD